MNDYELSIVKYLAEYHLKCYGFDIMFKQSEYSNIIWGNKSVSHKTDSITFDYERTGVKYMINLIINDKIILNDKSSMFKRCIYCKERYTTAKLTCCGKNCHINCASSNNYECNCKKSTGNIISLVSNTETCVKCDDQEDNEADNKCSVCFEECTSKTKCGHLICRECVDNIYKLNREKSNCPLCRKSLCDNSPNVYVLDNIFDKYPEYKVKVIIHKT